MASQVRIRPASSADQQAITALVRGARLNPRDLDWRRFVVAVEEGSATGPDAAAAEPGRAASAAGPAPAASAEPGRAGILACAQVRVHRQGTRELASVAVEPRVRGRGVGRAVVEATLDANPGELYLVTERATVGFFEQFGFVAQADRDLPADFRGPLRVGRLVTLLVSPLAGRRLRLVPMRRTPSTSAPATGPDRA